MRNADFTIDQQQLLIVDFTFAFCTVCRFVYVFEKRSMATAEIKICAPPAKLTSKVWKHFGFPTKEKNMADETRVICRLCKFSSKYNGSTTKVNKPYILGTSIYYILLTVCPVSTTT